MNPLILLATLPLLAAGPATVAKMHWDRRVLIVAAPSAQDSKLVAQRKILAGWHERGEARDLSIVSVVGDRVEGAADGAAALRRQHRLAASGFTAILIGKDGGEKLRSARPFTAAVLETTIDAMPMRKAGQR